MSITDIISELDAEIARLQNARSLLALLAMATAVHGKVKSSPSTTKKRKKRKLSKEGREKIAAAQRKRGQIRKGLRNSLSIMC